MDRSIELRVSQDSNTNLRQEFVWILRCPPLHVALLFSTKHVFDSLHTSGNSAGQIILSAFVVDAVEQELAVYGETKDGARMLSRTATENPSCKNWTRP